MDEIIIRESKEALEFIETLNELLLIIETTLKESQPALNGEKYLTDKELSEKLKISRRTLQDYRNHNLIPYIQLPGKILYKESDIEKLLADNYIAGRR